MRLRRLFATLAPTTLLLAQAIPAPSPDELAQTAPAGDEVRDTKYFHEPGTDDLLGHYDQRYFNGVVSYEERTDTLHHMIRAYLNTFRELEIETWIAHGTLLGWWWNGKILPWDWDLDTQVSGATLEYLAEHMNRTTHHYSDEENTIERDYLLDINPFSSQRERGDGLNIIDARWIDVRNGLYIDITGLSETHPDIQPGVWSCKNYHRYRTKDLYPMRDSTFEGVPAKIPYAYDRMLTEEYDTKALVLTEYQGHQWDPKSRNWIKKETLLDGKEEAQHPLQPQPHVPRHLRPPSNKPGLGNIWRLLQ